MTFKKKPQAGFDFFYVVMKGGPDAKGITVSCTIHENAWEKLKKGDKVTLKGDVYLLDEATKSVTVNSSFIHPN